MVTAPHERSHLISSFGLLLAFIQKGDGRRGSLGLVAVWRQPSALMGLGLKVALPPAAMQTLRAWPGRLTPAITAAGRHAQPADGATRLQQQ